MWHAKTKKSWFLQIVICLIFKGTREVGSMIQVLYCSTFYEPSLVEMERSFFNSFFFCSHLNPLSAETKTFWENWFDALGADSLWRCHLASIGIPTVEIRQSYDCLISTMGFPIQRQHLYIESRPWQLMPWAAMSGLILGLRPANERLRYFVTASLIGWVQA